MRLSRKRHHSHKSHVFPWPTGNGKIDTFLMSKYLMGDDVALLFCVRQTCQSHVLFEVRTYYTLCGTSVRTDTYVLMTITVANNFSTFIVQFP